MSVLNIAVVLYQILVFSGYQQLTAFSCQQQKNSGQFCCMAAYSVAHQEDYNK